MDSRWKLLLASLISLHVVLGENYTQVRKARHNWISRYNEDTYNGPHIHRTYQAHPSRAIPYYTIPTVRQPPVPPMPRTTTFYPPFEPVQYCGQCTNIALKFSGLGLKRIGGHFVTSSEVSVLYLNDNDITEVSLIAFESLDKLQVLDLSKNSLAIDKLLHFGRHNTLQKLIIDDNRYDGTDTDLKNFHQMLPMLRELSLKRDNITELNVNLVNFAPKLTHLYLSGNKIESTEFMDDAPKTLTHLHLNNNLITELNASNLTAMEELDVSDNDIEKICLATCGGSFLTLKNMNRLLRLNVSWNGISDVSEDSFEDVVALRILDLSHNYLHRLPDRLFNGMSSVKELHMAYNAFTSIPNVCSLVDMKLLDLSRNNIVAVTKENICPQSMKVNTLILANNHITNVNATAFDHMPWLQRLDLSNNLIMELPVTLISRCMSLEVLQLQNNSILSIDHLPNARSTSLRELHLQDNPLPFITLGRLHLYTEVPNLVLHLRDPSKEAEKVSSSTEEEESYNDVDEQSS